MQLYEPGVNASEATSECIAPGRSREPPVFTRFGGTSDQTKIARVAGHAPKQLPSKLWAITHHMNSPTLFEYEDETKEIRVYAAWLYIPPIEQNRRMARTQRRSLGKKDYKRIDSVLDDRLRLFAVGRLDRKSRDKLVIELARNPEWVDRLAEHLHASSPL